MTLRKIVSGSPRHIRIGSVRIRNTRTTHLVGPRVIQAPWPAATATRSSNIRIRRNIRTTRSSIRTRGIRSHKDGI